VYYKGCIGVLYSEMEMEKDERSRPQVMG
jgi:hypothetical protein